MQEQMRTCAMKKERLPCTLSQTDTASILLVVVVVVVVVLGVVVVVVVVI